MVPARPLAISGADVIWQLIFGLVLMLAGGEALVRGAVALAERLGVSPLVIGVTLIGFGTSAPELATCIDAALRGAPGIAVGNVVGSNIANVLLILAVGALLYPIAANRRALGRDGPVLMAATLICMGIIMHGHVGRWLGAALFTGLVIYLVAAALDDRRQMAKTENQAKADDRPFAIPLHLGLVVFGLAAVLFGADLLVQAAVDLAALLGVSDAVIGLTVVAIGTSLPELATAVIASLKRQSELVFGNVIGSNIFNSLGIFGATALVQPIDVPGEIAGFDVWVMLGATALLLIFATTGWRISRREGAVLLVGYIAFIGLHAGAI
ncbi:MAG: calcium/sodium antiporter [Pseudomonadota bacterium]